METVHFHCREDECNCRGGYWRMKCAKADTVFIYIFYMLSSGNDCELSRIGLLTSSVNILE